MTHPFIPLADHFFVSPQITVENIAAAKEAGTTLIINNRPDGEGPGQPSGDTIKAAATEAGIAYLALPVGPAGISLEMLDSLNKAIEANSGNIIAYCASGTRSAILRAFALAKTGRNIDQLIEEAAAAGFDIAGQRPVMESLQQQSA